MILGDAAIYISILILLAIACLFTVAGINVFFYLIHNIYSSSLLFIYQSNYLSILLSYYISIYLIVYLSTLSYIYLPYYIFIYLSYYLQRDPENTSIQFRGKVLEKFQNVFALVLYTYIHFTSRN